MSTLLSALKMLSGTENQKEKHMSMEIIFHLSLLQ